MELVDLTTPKETKNRGFSAARLAAMSISLTRRTTRATFGEGQNERTYTVLTHPLTPEDTTPPYTARLPKRMILPGLKAY